MGERHHLDRGTVLGVVHEITSKMKTSDWIANHLKPRWSGTLIVDGKTIKIYDRYAKKFRGRISEQEYRTMMRKRWVCGIDHGTGDLPHYALADSENRIDLILFFRQIKENGYNLSVLVSDDNPEILHAARKVYGPDFVFQLCTRHFTQNLKKVMNEKEQENETPNTELLINLIRSAVEARTTEEANKNLNLLKSNKHLWKTPTQIWIKEQFKHKAIKLFSHLQYPSLQMPHTNNDIENLFKQLNINLKCIGRFMKFRYARDYLSAWALRRRFTKFTDSKKKKRRGKAPLELAGCDIKNRDFLNLN